MGVLLTLRRGWAAAALAATGLLAGCERECVPRQHAAGAGSTLQPVL